MVVAGGLGGTVWMGRAALLLGRGLLVPADGRHLQGGLCLVQVDRRRHRALDLGGVDVVGLAQNAVQVRGHVPAGDGGPDRGGQLPLPQGRH